MRGLIDRKHVVPAAEAPEDLAAFQAALQRAVAESAIDASTQPRQLTALILPNGEQAVLPFDVERLLVEMVDALARGDMVTFIPAHREFTTQESADYLNMSRQHFVRLLEAGELPFHLVGSHRRVYFQDLLAYRQRRDEKRQRGMSKLRELSQEMGLYDLDAEPMPKIRRRSHQ